MWWYLGLAVVLGLMGVILRAAVNYTKAVGLYPGHTPAQNYLDEAHHGS